MKIALKLLLIVAVAAFMGAVVWKMLCWPRWDIEVFVNGDLQPNASVTTCPNGRILVDVPGESSVLIDPDLRAGAYPGTRFYNVFGLRFSHDPNPGGISIADEVKIDNNPGVEFSDGAVTYSDLLSHDRILIRRKK